MRRQHKICTADEAVMLIENGMTVASGGFVGAAHPEALTAALERRFLTSGNPSGLTLVYGAGQGDGKHRGLNHLAHEKLVKHVIGAHWGLVPRMGRLAIDEKIAAHCFPQGVMCQLFRDIAAGRPGCITHVGLDTFADPLHDGGRLNRSTPEGYVERISLGGKDWLWYKAFPIHVGLIRATVADLHGNLSMEGEAIVGEVLPIAQAAHNCGGIVLAQVKRLSDKPLPPHQVRVPGILIDRIVISEGDEHDQTFGVAFNPAFTQPSPDEATIDWPEPLPMDARRIVAGRACDEVPHEAIANLGIGMPEGIARIAAERGWLNRFTLTVESGPIGGMPVGGLSFGASFHPQAIVDQPAQFDMYDGRALDMAALGAAQIDAEGNVNVSRFGPKVAGIGGFANITQTARKLVFCCTFTAGDLQISVENGQLKILSEGRSSKFVPQVEHRSFSARRSREVGQEVLYVTERAVFALTAEGLELIEIAPGIDLQRDVLDKMAFRPVVRQPKIMPPHLFALPTLR